MTPLRGMLVTGVIDEVEVSREMGDGGRDDDEEDRRLLKEEEE